MVNLSKLSESLKELMAEHNLNQVALAAKLGSGRTKFSDILDAKNAPNYNTFVKLIGYFNCSADFLPKQYYLLYLESHRISPTHQLPIGQLNVLRNCSH